MEKEKILELLKSHSMRAKVYGAMTDLIPDTEFNELANEILLLIEPVKDDAIHTS